MHLPRLYIPIAPAAHQANNRFAQTRFAIQSAAWKGKTDELLELLEKFPRRATNALYWAAGNGHQETVKALLSHGARPTLTAITAAKSNDHQTIARMIERKAAEKLRRPTVEL